MTETTMIRSLSVERLQELLQTMGYRVTVAERDGQRQLLSATQGIGFSVRPGNLAPTEGEFIDYTLGCVLRLEGSLSAGVVDSWNVQKRFARLTQQSTFLVLEMDVVVAGGVSESYLRAAAELWDRLLQEFLLFLRQYADQTRADAQSDGSVSPSSDETAPAPEASTDAQAGIEQAESTQA
ncbi:YbjN domain-containing protein [Alcaligenes aquatilis]|uniref:YbjN domain-containing protein n=1 Tax=Alcaligenes aquatilis TaxID=323284 RepID=A0A3G2HQW3_9BURK|nr:YbjN domain-containing protein [Alcaligenes aquatilis]AYN19523.1 YbjN domain-containing protein [Alcaligenes aquatilis]